MRVAGIGLRADVHEDMPQLSWRAQGLVDEMLLTDGTVGPAQEVARRLGFGDRFALALWLAHEGLPPLHKLAGWMRVALCVDITERVTPARHPSSSESRNQFHHSHVLSLNRA